MKALRKTPPQARHHFTLADQVGQLVGASEADADLGFMAKAIKQTYPLRPMPAAPENGEDVTDALGQVFCESCNQTYPWEYRVAS